MRYSQHSYWSGMPAKARRHLWFEGAFWCLLIFLYLAGTLWWVALVAVRAVWLLLKLWFWSEVGMPGIQTSREDMGFLSYTSDYVLDRSPLARMALGLAMVIILVAGAFELWTGLQDQVAAMTSAEDPGALERAWGWAREKAGL